MSSEVKKEVPADPGEGTSAGPSKNGRARGGSPPAATSAVDVAVPSTSSSAAADTKSASVKSEAKGEVKEEPRLKTEEEEEDDDLAASETMEDTSEDDEDEEEVAKALSATGGASVKDEDDDEEEDPDDPESNPDNPENNEEYAAQVLGQKPIQDMKLETALQGQEPTTRNLIIAAIGVMKNRKARPDSKRICNWIHRRYGQPYMAINAELERLVAAGELARVDYKGSASFRIINKTGKVTKKRKKGSKPPAAAGRAPALNTPPATPQHMPAALQSPGGPADFMRPPPPPMPPQQGDFQTAYGSVQSAAAAFANFEPPQQIIAPPGALSMTSMPAPPLHSQEAISLRTLVNDILGDSAGNQGVTITTKFISKAIESTHRNIARATILGNLDLILEKEVQAGHFSKIGPDTYAVPPFQNLPANLPFVPLPMAMPDPMMAPPPPPPPPVPPQQHHLPMPMGQSSFSMEKTDEERKNELIQDTLSKLSSKDSPRASKTGAGGSGGKSSKGSHSASATASSPAKEPIYLTLREKRMAELSKKNSRAAAAAGSSSGSGGAGGEREKKGLRRAKQELDEDSMPLAEARSAAMLAAGGSGGGTKGKRRQREEWQMKPPATNREQQQSDGGSGRLGSGRKKVSKGRFIHQIVIMLEIISRAHPRLISRPATAKMSPKQSRHFATLPSTDNSAAALSDGRTIGRSDGWIDGGCARREKWCRGGRRGQAASSSGGRSSFSVPLARSQPAVLPTGRSPSVPLSLISEISDFDLLYRIASPI